ncbi:DgyrCDS1612 [Dimorphilus gyrociliatus]|uniref:DgyrCDS1612 n=1 Tax=Dimorphilus gyrociliatus TaxID=2664684 RepID=A0A7I8VB27_9ANNE|nr:DgyrCDS1612 [Dimorphilus gyrociliatus]
MASQPPHTTTIQIPFISGLSVPTNATTVFLPIQTSNIVPTRNLIPSTPALLRGPVIAPQLPINLPIINRLVPPHRGQTTKPIAPKNPNAPPKPRVVTRSPRPITPTVREVLEQQKKIREKEGMPVQLVINQQVQSQPIGTQVQYMQMQLGSLLPATQRKIAPKTVSSLGVPTPITVHSRSPSKSPMKQETTIQLEATSENPVKENDSISSDDSLCKLTEDFDKEQSVGDTSEAKNDMEEEEDEDEEEEEMKCKNETNNEAEMEDFQASDEFEEIEFQWGDYLEITDSKQADDDCFEHVQNSLSSCVKAGMIVEVEHGEQKYWPARIQIVAGPVLNMRYIGANSSNKELWLKPSQVHPLNWGKNNDSYSREPPEDIKENREDWDEFIERELDGAGTPLDYVFESDSGTTAIDFVRKGQLLEVQHYKCCPLIWPVRVIRNVGGRLLLRFVGTGPTEDDESEHGEIPKYKSDFWLFFLHYRLHPVGWGKEKGLEYKPIPEIVDQHKSEEWNEILNNCFSEAEKNPPPIDLFNLQREVQSHTFQKGDKLEAMHPNRRCSFHPATIAEVLDEYFCIVELDDYDGEEIVRMCCHSGSCNIFPVKTCETNGIKIKAPKASKNPEFNWDEYLEKTGSKAASPDCFLNKFIENVKFAKGDKLEVVHPENPDVISPATVSLVVQKLLFLHLDSETSKTNEFVRAASSMDIFPVGWCDSNDYPLELPHKSRLRVKVKRNLDTETGQDRSENYSDEHSQDGSCPKIYFNHQCFSGPFLNKGQLSMLPKSLGPGPIELVLTEVLSKLINVAYKPSFVLRLFSLQDQPNPNMKLVSLKAKYKGRQYRASAEICSSASQVINVSKK